MDDKINGSPDHEADDGEPDRDRTQAFDSGLLARESEDDTDISASWKGIGATRGPRSPAEGVRIIGAKEAASAIETGQATPRMPDDAPKFGDVPEPPRGPRPSIRFPGSDPSTLAKPPVVEPPPLRNLWDSPNAPASAAAGVARSERPDPGAGPPRVGRFEELVARDRSELARDARPSQDPSLAQPQSVSQPPSWDLFEDPALSGENNDPFSESEDPLSYSSASIFDEQLAGVGRSSPSEAMSAPPGATADHEPSTVALPHWTEPPSGEVPRLLPDSVFPESAGAEDPSSWSTLSTGPRWRDQPTDWDDSDFHETLGEDRSVRVGALREGSPADDDPFPMVPASPLDRGAGGARAAAAGTRRRTSRAPGVGEREFTATDYTRPGPDARSPSSQVNGEMGGPGGSAPSADIGTRVVTGLIAGGLALACAAIGPRALVPLIAVALVLAAAELHQALRAGGYQPATLLGLVATASVVGAAYWKGEQALPLLLTLVLVFSMLWYLLGVVHARPAVNVAVTVMAFVYIGFLGSYASLMLKFPNGVGLLLGAILATVAHDVGSYFAGRMGGRTPLAPAISPNKTLEGLVGGTFATLFVCLLVVRAMDPPWTTSKAFWLAVVVSIVSPLGDLCESLIKRDLGVKDMGKMLPGHGGVLDRIDALIFVIPATYYLARVMEIF